MLPIPAIDRRRNDPTAHVAIRCHAQSVATAHALPHRSRIATALAGLTALLFSLIALPAAAQVERCVRNVAEFNSAWLVADDDPVTIKMAAGTYDLAGSVVDSPSDSSSWVGVDDDVTIRGGYNSNCTSRSEDPGATILTHSAGGRLLFQTHGSAVAGNGFLRLERLTFRGVGRITISTEQSLTPDAYAELSRVWVDQSGYIDMRAAAEFRVDNSLFTRNGACPLTIANNDFGSYLEHAVVRNSTFAGNAGPGLCVGHPQHGADDWRIDLTNSVFWNNGGTDIRLVNPSQTTYNAVLRNNIYTTLVSDRALRTPPTGTLSSDPQFVNAAAGNWRLTTTSPAINTGRINVNLLAESDFEGNPRWYGDAPDRGAFESNIGSTATVLTVTNSNDSGPGSLRQALIDANASPNLNRIRFSIGSTCGPRVITLNSLLPTIAHPLVIEGYSQPGASPNTAILGNNAVICVIINGNNQITGSYGLNVATDASVNATVSIEGVAFGGHSIAAVQFAGGRDHRLTGVQVGGTVGGVDLLPSATGVRVGGLTEGVRIGGPAPGDRNVVVHGTGIGINVTGSGNNQPVDAIIENNFVGTQNGGDVRGNQRGIVISGTGHVVRGNVVANSASHGIELTGSYALDNRLLDNRIGIPGLCLATCANRGNGGHGIRIANGADGNRIEGNHIAFSGEDGVAIVNAGLNTVRRNRFHDNAGIGIDLGDNGRDLVNGNNTQPPANAANGNQNNPTITDAVGTSGRGTATGTLTSRNGWYRIDFYAAPQCQLVFQGVQPQGFWGQGQDWLGSTFVQIGNGTGSSDGTAGFQGTITGPSGSYFDTQRQIMATATRLSGNPSTFVYQHLGSSEFGRCRGYLVSDVIFADGFQSP